MKDQFTSKILALIALGAIIIYSINCRPAWNPEGNKIAYIYSNKCNGDNYYGIAIYDLNKKESQSIIEATNEAQEEFLIPIEVFWSPKGDELIYVSTPKDDSTFSSTSKDTKKSDKIVISKYNLQLKEKKKINEIQVPGVSSASSMYPIILKRERWLWIAGEDAYYRVDIKKNKGIKLKHEHAFVFGNNKNLFFVFKGDNNELILGKIKTFFVYKEELLFTIPLKEKERTFLIGAIPAKRTQFAYIKNVEEKLQLIIVNKKGKSIKKIGLPDSVTLEDDEFPLHVQAEWNHKGTILWIVVKVKDKDKQDNFAIAEVNIVNESTRLIQFQDIASKLEEEITPLHFALSPDQKYLAISLMGENLLCLGLIDLTNNERKVTIAHPSSDLLSKLQGEN